MLSEEVTSRLRDEAKNHLPKHGAHSYEHTERVYKTCIFLGSKVGADESILLPAALLHDIGRGKENHAMAGADMAKSILLKLGFTKDRIKRVADAISVHSFSEKKTAVTIEARVLSDADKLDALGAIGIYRAAAYRGEEPRSIEEFIAHFYDKLLKLSHLFYTDDAKLMAENRISFMQVYLEKLRLELSQKA